MEAPAAAAYAVLPVGVETMTPERGEQKPLPFGRLACLAGTGRTKQLPCSGSPRWESNKLKRSPPAATEVAQQTQGREGRASPLGGRVTVHSW